VTARLPPRQLRALRDLPPTPAAETTTADKIFALEGELALLKPYASTKGLSRLKGRVAELETTIRRLKGFDLDD